MNWEQAWLAYKPMKNYPDAARFAAIECDAADEISANAVDELCRAAEGLFGTTPRRGAGGIRLALVPGDGAEGSYSVRDEGDRGLTVSAATPVGLLYGVFGVIRRAAQGLPLRGFSADESPKMPLRMQNHWDNVGGMIERGYAGPSFFFENDQIIPAGERLRDYARLCASVGLNAVVINNVNVRGRVEVGFIAGESLDLLAEYERVFSSYGISLYLSLSFAAPIEIGGMSTADPLDPEVAAWWRSTFDALYERLPRFGGFLIKADSEGRPGPFTYGRDHTDGANMLARAIRPHGGRIIWRAFVYNCRQDWRDRETDRARAAYDCYLPLDGKFDDNVILQIKNGPMDFQVREPVHPLFGALDGTNLMLEVQAAQEYTGQQLHVCYLIPMWKEVLDFHTECGGEDDTVADIVSGRASGNCGMAAVTNTGADPNWTGHDLAGANFYGFGRLAWDPGLGSEEIAREWVAQGLSRDPEVISVVTRILMRSWPAYEGYNAPLGLGWLCSGGKNHYGPDLLKGEYARFGTYQRADCRAVGIERGESGTGYALLYKGKNAAIYNDPDTCPEELLLFFHRISYDHVLPSGKTLLQHIYDSRFDGAEEVGGFIGLWEGLHGRIEEPIYSRVLARLHRQAEDAVEWCDVVNSFFYRFTLVPDAHGRRIY